MQYWSLILCDVWVKSEFEEKNNYCPRDYHVPNYWEMFYIIDSWIGLNLDWEYYIDSLYWDINKGGQYPFAWNPFSFNKWKLNHTVDYNANWNVIYWITDKKRDTLCVANSSNTPRNDLKWASWTSCKIDLTWLKWKYTLNSNRRYLFRDETLVLESANNILDSGKYDFSLMLECTQSWLEKVETINRVHSCNYWFINTNNNCIPDENICNLTNFWNTHTMNWKVCSWKSLWSESYDVWSHRYWKSILSESSSLYNPTIVSEIYKKANSLKQQLIDKYIAEYNNKTHIQVECEFGDKTTDRFGSLIITYNCNVKGLFWMD